MRFTRTSAEWVSHACRDIGDKARQSVGYQFQLMMRMRLLLCCLRLPTNEAQEALHGALSLQRCGLLSGAGVGGSHCLGSASLQDQLCP